VTLIVDDLRPAELNLYGERVTQLVSMSVTQLAVRLPVWADLRTSSGWSDPIELGQVYGEHVATSLTREQMLSLSSAFNASLNTDPSHEFIRLSKYDPVRRVFSSLTLGLLWHPLGTNLAVESPTIDLVYSVAYPFANLVGPALHAHAQFALQSGALIELTVQIDRGYAIGGFALPSDPPGHTGLYLLPPLVSRLHRTSAYIDGMDVVDIVQRMCSNSSIVSSAVPSSLIKGLTFDADLFGCLSATKIWLLAKAHGRAASGPLHPSCPAFLAGKPARTPCSSRGSLRYH